LDQKEILRVKRGGGSIILVAVKGGYLRTGWGFWEGITLGGGEGVKLSNLKGKCLKKEGKRYITFGKKKT